MARAGVVVRQGIARVGEEIHEAAWRVGRDPAHEARMRRRWGFVQAATGAVFTLAARRLATRVWWILTGESPPGRR